MVVLITLFSCTNESVDPVPVQLLKKIVEVSVDGSSSTTLLTYEGFKIVNIDKFDKLSVNELKPSVTIKTFSKTNCPKLLKTNKFKF